MKELKHTDCDFERSSTVDQVGQVFRYQGRLFRAIHQPALATALQAIDLAETQGWFDLGLIPTWRTDYQMVGYAAVIEHRRLPYVTVRAEWSGEGLRQAALCYLRVAAALARSQLCLKDSHPWNVLFERSNPHIIDWGSIRPMAELNWDFWYWQFRRYFLVPLYLFAHGQPVLARAMMREHIIGVGNILADLPIVQHLPETTASIFQHRHTLLADKVFEAWADHVSSMVLPKVVGEWADYEQPRFLGLAALDRLRLKDRLLLNILQSDSGTTVLDIGCNLGVHSEMCAELGKRVVATDIEESCLNDLFIRTTTSQRDVLTVYMDFLWPMGDSGVMNSLPSAAERLGGDTCLAMALIHHLVFKHQIGFETFAWHLSKFARQRAIVEFVPADDVYVAQWAPERFPWYTLENLIAAMQKHFERCEVIASDPSPRKLLICDRKRHSTSA
ncbi:MAG: hypothetical protein ACT4QE_21475 [Anaerolineales bacterium]